MNEGTVVGSFGGKPYQAQYSVSNGRVYLKSEFGEANDTLGIFRPDFVARTILRNMLAKAMNGKKP